MLQRRMLAPTAAVLPTHRGQEVRPPCKACDRPVEGWCIWSGLGGERLCNGCFWWAVKILKAAVAVR